MRFPMLEGMDDDSELKFTISICKLVSLPVQGGIEEYNWLFCRFRAVKENNKHRDEGIDENNEL